MNSEKNPWPPYVRPAKKERPISKHYHAIDSDLARDNLENDIPEGDLNDLNTPLDRPAGICYHQTNQS